MQLRRHQTIIMKTTTARYIVIKLSRLQHKEKIIKLTRGKKPITYKGKPTKLTSDFSEETLQAGREWSDILKRLQDKKCQPRIFCPAKLSFLYEQKIRTFSDKQNVKKFATINFPL